jgi:hypothetical protein
MEGELSKICSMHKNERSDKHVKIRLRNLKKYPDGNLGLAISSAQGNEYSGPIAASLLIRRV